MALHPNIASERAQEHLATEVDLTVLFPGRVTALLGAPGSGLTRLGLAMLSNHTGGGPIAYLDVRGWFCPLAAWELGIPPEQLVVVRCADVVRWGKVAATLLDGVRALYAEIPHGVKDPVLRRLAARAMHRGTAVLLRPLRGSVPPGVAHLRIETQHVLWEGPVAGHGRLQVRRSLLVASGKATRGMTRTYEMEDDGTHSLRLVPRVGASELRSAAS